MVENILTEIKEAHNNVLLLMQVRIQGYFSASKPHE